MKTQHLHDMWSSPDNSRLVSKQFSFRLPVHIAAKLAALAELYPQKNRTQVVADLLTAALDDLEANLPQELGAAESQDDARIEKLIANNLGEEYEPYYELSGARAQFRALANKHYKELENELGNEAAAQLYSVMFVTKSQINNK